MRSATDERREYDPSSTNRILTENTTERGDHGSGSPCIARPFASQCLQLIAATAAQRRMSGSPSGHLAPNDVKPGESWLAATPVAIRVPGLAVPGEKRSFVGEDEADVGFLVRRRSRLVTESNVGNFG